jgi:hypothetical protein
MDARAAIKNLASPHPVTVERAAKAIASAVWPRSAKVPAGTSAALVAALERQQAAGNERAQAAVLEALMDYCGAAARGPSPGSSPPPHLTPMQAQQLIPLACRALQPSGTRIAAVGLLGYISLYGAPDLGAQLSQQLAAAGAAQHVVQQLRCGDTQVRVRALLLLKHLLRNIDDPQLQQRAVPEPLRPEVARQLAAVLQDPRLSSEAGQARMCLMQLLVWGDYGNDTAVCSAAVQAGALRALVPELERPGFTALAAAVIGLLAKGGQETAVLEAGAAPALVKVLQAATTAAPSPNDAVRAETALAALQELTASPGGVAALLEAGAGVALLQVVEHSKLEQCLKTTASKFLDELAADAAVLAACDSRFEQHAERLMGRIMAGGRGEGSQGRSVSRPPVAASSGAPAAAAAAGGERCEGCGAAEGPGGAKLRRCAGCRVAVFCSPECQRGNWRAHKARCREVAAGAGAAGAGAGGGKRGAQAGAGRAARSEGR